MSANFMLKIPLYTKNQKLWNGSIVVLACKYCNYTEYCLRNNIQGGRQVLKRFQKVLKYQAKFGIIM